MPWGYGIAYIVRVYLLLSNIHHFVDRSCWPMDVTVTATTTPGQSEPWNCSNEEVLHRGVEL